MYACTLRAAEVIARFPAFGAARSDAGRGGRGAQARRLGGVAACCSRVLFLLYNDIVCHAFRLLPCARAELVKTRQDNAISIVTAAAHS